MDTTPTQRQQQNFADFWPQLPSTSAPSVPPSFFYTPPPGQRPAVLPAGQQQSNPATTRNNEQQQLISSVSAAQPQNSPSIFQSALQQNRQFVSNFDVFSADRMAATAGISHPNFRPPPPLHLGASHFDPTANVAGQFSQNFPTSLLHAGPNVSFQSAVVAASVGLDCMGLMNNFGLNSTTNHFAVPNNPQPANLQSSAALMPLAMSAIYASGGGGIQRPPNILQSPTMNSNRSAPISLSATPGAIGTGNQPSNSASQLFDLSNQVANSRQSAASAIASAVSNANGIGTFCQQPQEILSKRISGTEQLPIGAFGTFPGGKQSAEIAKIPKETATIPLESSSEGTSSAGTTEQRAHQPHMSCQVCHLAASNGLHFGARTCAACAAFFRRSISDQKRYICKRSQRCVIRPNETQGYRKMCRNCRMKRCLEIGMLPENVQNKRNKREYYFVDALNNAIQQAGGVQQQQIPTAADCHQQGIAGIGQPLPGAKSEIEKLLGTPLMGSNCGAGIGIANMQQMQQQQQQQVQLNPVEKFEPQDKDSPNDSTSTGIPNSDNEAQQMAHPTFQAALQPQLLMGSIEGQQQQASILETIGKNERGGNGATAVGPIYSTPTTINQQQPLAPFPWGLNTTTLREMI